MATERFAASGNLLKLKNKRKTLHSLNLKNCKSAYGTVLISSKNNDKQYTWTLKMDKFGCGNPNKAVDIGIQDSKLNTLESEFYPHVPAYCFQSAGNIAVNGKLEIAADVFEQGDVVTMQLDMKRHTIQYLVNNKNTGVIIRNITQKDDLQYRLAVTVRGTAKVSLMSFQVNDATEDIDDTKLDNNETIFEKCDQLQNELSKKMTEITKLNKKLKSTQQQEEKKIDDCNEDVIDKIANTLESEFINFKKEYNQNKLQEIFDKSSDTLINKESALNKKYIQYEQAVDKLVISSKAFSKYIEDVGNMLDKFRRADPTGYKLWNVKQILIWIQGLENGRFKKYIDKLQHGFEKSEIIGEDLPDLTRNDLSSPPFDIGNFRDRKQLEMHFKSLKTHSHKNQDVIEEGINAPTAYI
eukprot:249064_1